jgi:hypothetical protein
LAKHVKQKGSHSEETCKAQKRRRRQAQKCVGQSLFGGI